MALSDLLEALTREADERAAQALSAARAEAERLVRETRTTVERRLAEATAAHESGLRAAAQGEIETARRAAAQDVLVARAEALARVFARSRELLTERVCDPALAPRWSRDEAEALTYIPGGRGVVRRPPDAAGVVATAADGSVEVDGTVDALLLRLKPLLGIEVARRLEDGS
jgi:vacuolar-type H+-ATPase subunit E/Vma4